MWLVNIRSAAHARARCHRIDAVALAHFSQRVNCLSSQETTSSSAPTSLDVTSHQFDGAASLWQLLAISADRLASPLRFVMCEACLHADCQACFLGVCGPRPPFVARSIRVLARMQAG